MKRRSLIMGGLALVATSGAFMTEAHAAAKAAKPLVALTFDDGPHPTGTPIVLDTLKSKGIKGTFFLLGEQVVKYPDLVKRIHDEGHVLGNHSWNHADFNTLTFDQARKQIVDTNDAIQTITGTRPQLFRYPFGRESAVAFPALQEFNMWSVLWKTTPTFVKSNGASFVGDWTCDNTKADTTKYMVSTASGQAVILLHDGGDAGACGGNHWKYLAPAIAQLKQDGYKFGVVDIAYEASPLNQYSWIQVVAG